MKPLTLLSCADGRRAKWRASLLVLAALVVAGCGGGGYGGGGAGGGGGAMAVYGPPNITMQPANVTVSAGHSATFSVVAGGYGPFSYQWMKNSSNISGATAASYTTPPVSSSDNNAQFAVIVTNAYGSTTSNHAILTVM